MKKILFVMLFATLITVAGAAAYYVAPSGGYYVPSTGYGSYDYNRGTVTYNGYRGNGVYDGRWGLVDRTPYPYPRSYSLEENRLSYGEYSRFTGRYHHPFTGRTMRETWNGYGNSNAIPYNSYPYVRRTLHRE